MKGVLKGRLKALLKETGDFINKQDTFRDKSLEINKSIKRRLQENPNLTVEDFTEELVTLEKNFFFDNLLTQNTNKLNIQLSALYQVAVLGKVDLELSEDQIKFLDQTVKSDFDLFKIEKGEIKTLNNDYIKAIITKIESRSAESRKETFTHMLNDPNFKSLEV